MSPLGAGAAGAGAAAASTGTIMPPEQPPASFALASSPASRPADLMLSWALESLRASFPAAASDDCDGTATAAARASEVLPQQQEPTLVLLSVPSLSLHHETRLGNRDDKRQVEEYAACLLARPVTVKVKANPGRLNVIGSEATYHGSDALSPTRGDAATSFLLMENLAESFGVLIDSRLRAYATFLARHGIALAKSSLRSFDQQATAAAKAKADAMANTETVGVTSSLPPPSSIPGVLTMEEKVRSLLEMGASVRASRMTLDFFPTPRQEESSRSCSTNGSENYTNHEDSPKHPVSMLASMQLEMTGPNGDQESLRSVSIAAQGYARVSNKGADDPHPHGTLEIVVSLDARKLLENMIHQASDVVADVVDAANTSSILSASRLCRSSSFLAMPPPPPAGLSGINRRSESFLRLPSGGDAGADSDGSSDDDIQARPANRATVIVSPDTNALAASQDAGGAIPMLNLNEGAAESRAADDEIDDDDDDEYFLQDLSPEACETIVDGIFGGSIGVGAIGNSRSSHKLSDDDDDDDFASKARPPLKKPRIENLAGPAGSNMSPVVAHNESLMV